MKYAFLFVIALCAGCAKHSGPNLCTLVKEHSPQLRTTKLEIDPKMEGHALGKVDSAFIPALDKFGLIEADHPDENWGCLHCLYYYGHLQLGNSLMGAVFSYDVCSCCGDKRLLLAVMDMDGNIKSAFVAAQELEESECTMEINTRIEGAKFIVAQGLGCAVLADSVADRFADRLDSSTKYYTLATNGELVLQSADSATLMR